MPTELKLPLLGDVMQEGTVAEWLRADGTLVAAGDPIYRLETDKVSFDVEAPVAGVLRQLVAEGETVEVGTLVGQLLESIQEAPEAPEVRATPLARRLARQRGVDLAQLATGRLIRERDLDQLGLQVQGGEELSARRRVIADRMHASLQQMAQLTISLEVDFSRALELRGQLKELWADEA